MTNLAVFADVAGSAEARVMPGGVLTLVGSAILVVVGMRWLVHDDEVTAPARTEERSLPVGCAVGEPHAQDPDLITRAPATDPTQTFGG